MRRLSLVTRFAAVSLTLVVLLGIALSQVLSSLIERRALESAKQAAILSVAVGIQPLLQGEDARAAYDRVGLSSYFTGSVGTISI